jgi:K+-sensing histidine kinase KdpD
MRVMRLAVPVAVSLAVACSVTAILWYIKVSGAGPLHPVFFYLLPIALLAILYGRLPALICASVAAACSAFFLYDPVYSFQVSNRLEVGDLVCFAVLALIGVQCAGELLRPPAKVPEIKSR